MTFTTERGSRPLLKWAGGKRQLLPTLRAYYPQRFSRYIEPFFGSGAVFFDLLASGALDGRRAWLVDANPDLVGCYRMLRDRTDEVIAALEDLAREHGRRGSECYYQVRDERFNVARRTGLEYTPALAAMLIYLNRTGFNGLFRLNRRGDFNVPVGRYENPTICDPTHLHQVAAALRSPRVRLDLSSFERPLAEAGAGDFVYCDPPYAPLSSTARFASYTAAGFDAADQHRLGDAVLKAAARGAAVLLSNSSAPIVEGIYSTPEAKAAGLEVLRVPARRAINSRADARGPVDELLVTNAAARTRFDLLQTVRPKMARSTGARTRIRRTA